MKILKICFSPKKKITVFLTILAIIGSFVGSAFLPSVAQAADPQFNIFTPYVHTQTYNQDYYLLDVKNDTKGTSWNFPISADAGDILTFYIYYHNGVNYTTANNTTLRVSLPSGQSTSHSVTGSVWADNATNATPSSPLSQSVPVNLSSAQSLQYVAGSAKWFPNQVNWQIATPTPFPSGQSDTQLFSSGINIGNIVGCWEFSGAITFQVSVGSSVVNSPDLAVTKLVRNQTAGQSTFSNSVNANVNDRLNWQIQVQNTGNATLNNVMVRDVLPSQLSYVTGSTQNNGVYTADGITSGSINVDSISQGASRTITFDATVNSFSSSQTVTNYAYARADQVSEKSSSASVYLTTSSQTGSLTVNKTVRNSTSGQGGYYENVNANSNDRLIFQIQVQNTSNTTLNNVFVYDTLPSYLSYAYGSARLDNNYLSDGLTSGGLNIGSIYANGTKTITFEATVNSSSYGSSQTLTNYAYARADQVSERSDTAMIYLGSSSSGGNLYLSKTVRNATAGTSMSSSINANIGDRLVFLIQLTTPTNASQISNIRVWDTLPSGLFYVSGSTRIDGSTASDGLTSGGLYLNNMSGNQTRSINFEATVNYNYYSYQTLTNYAYVSADNINQQSAYAQVMIGTTPTPTPTPYYPPSGFTKRVDNLTSPNGTQYDNTAREGETLKYTLAYTNNSSVTIYNVQFWDILPSYTTFLNADYNGYFNTSSNQTTWNMGSLAPGASATVSYQVRIQTVPNDNYVIANSAALKSDSFSFLSSNEVRTTVNAPQVKGAVVRAVTGSHDLSGNLAASLMISLWGIFALYLFTEYAPDWKKLRFRFVVWRIRLREKIS